MLHGHVPNIESMRAVGCLCYAAKIGEKDKFEYRAKRCVILGYSFGLKGYKLYNLESKGVLHSTDVLFQEHVFPFKEKVQQPPTPEKVTSFLWPHSTAPSSGTFIEMSPLQSDSNPRYAAQLPVQSEEGSFLNTSHDSFDSINPPQQRPMEHTNCEDRRLMDIQHQHTEHPTFRRSTRSRAVPVWLRDFIQPKSHRHPEDISQSHSLHSVVAHPLLRQ